MASQGGGGRLSSIILRVFVHDVMRGGEAKVHAINVPEVALAPAHGGTLSVRYAALGLLVLFQVQPHYVTRWRGSIVWPTSSRTYK